MFNTAPFTGVIVTSTAGSRTVTVIRESYGGAGGVVNASSDMGMMMQGTLLSAVVASYFGFKDSVVPQPGTKVLCIPDTPNSCIIIGCLPQPNMNLKNLPTRAALGQENAIADAANRVGHTTNMQQIQDNRRAADVVDGEYVVGNEFGVLVGLYQQMANLKASELAQVQCFLLDDLVRIISHNFQHYTALGEYNIYHDGKRLMCEFGATHKSSEIYGRPAVTSDNSGGPIFTKTGTHTVDDSQDFYDFTEDERIKAVERFKLFLGSVSDFLHLYVVRPDPSEVRVLDPSKTPSKPDTGMADLHIGTDGGIHARSVKEIFLEKTQWIRVPHRKAAPDDKQGDDAEELQYEEKKKFEFKDDYKYKENPFLYALQIRDYVAYVNEKLGYQNFKKHEKDFYVNDDIGNEHSLKEIHDIDQETKLHLKQYELRTAGVYLMPNGGILIRDAWNSSIVMEGGNISIQPAKDLILQPMRNLVNKTGGFISMAAKKDIDFSSTEGGMRFKAEKAQYIYSDKGGVVIESGGETDTPGSPDPTKQAVEQVGGVVIKSKLGVYNYAGKNVVNYAKQNVLIQGKQNVDITANNITACGKNNAMIMADNMAMLYSPKSSLVISDGSALIAGATSTALGQDEQNLGIMYDKDSMFIDILKGVAKVSEITSQLGKAKAAKEELLKQTVFQDEAKFDQLQFKFLSSGQYGSLNPTQDAIPSTIAQQDDLLTGMYGYSVWTEKEVNSSLPFPGKDLFENFYYKAEKPVNLEPNPMGKDYSNKADSENKPSDLTLTSLNEYRVQNI